MGIGDGGVFGQSSEDRGGGFYSYGISTLRVHGLGSLGYSLTSLFVRRSVCATYRWRTSNAGYLAQR